MIQVFTLEQEDEVEAISEPKHIWYDLTRIVVYTGNDIPQIASAEQP